MPAKAFGVRSSPVGKAPRPPRPIGIHTGAFRYTVRLSGLKRDAFPKNPCAFARYRHIKLAKAGWHGGDEPPATGYLSEL